MLFQHIHFIVSHYYALYHLNTAMLFQQIHFTAFHYYEQYQLNTAMLFHLQLFINMNDINETLQCYFNGFILQLLVTFLLSR